MEVADFLFLSRCAETHSNAGYLAGTAIWKKLVDVEAIAEYSDVYSQATYMNPQGQCSTASHHSKISASLLVWCRRKRDTFEFC